MYGKMANFNVTKVNNYGSYDHKLHTYCDLLFKAI